MSKPREFTIHSDETRLLCVVNGPQSNQVEDIHVIEKSAYDELFAAADEADCPCIVHVYAKCPNKKLYDILEKFRKTATSAGVQKDE